MSKRKLEPFETVASEPVASFIASRKDLINPVNSNKVFQPSYLHLNVTLIALLIIK